MKKIFLLIVLTSMLSCKQKIKEADISNLNGYWEIEKVDLPDGDKKEYKVNETIDFFKIENNCIFILYNAILSIHHLFHERNAF